MIAGAKCGQCELSHRTSSPEDVEWLARSHLIGFDVDREAVAFLVKHSR
jgi:hypothetical protein